MVVRLGQRHTLTYRNRSPQVVVTELSPLQRRPLRLFALDPTTTATDHSPRNSQNT